MAAQLEDTRRKRFLRAAQGAALMSVCGLMLWRMPLGRAWENASYDYLFRFGARPVTNNVSIILMDNEAYDFFHQTRDQPWDRRLHTDLLNRLADDGCALVVMDCFFGEPGDQAQDEALAKAMRRQRHIVLMAEQSRITHPTLLGIHPLLPAEPFYSASRGNYGVAWLDPDPDLIVRRHWPFPSPGPYPSLPEAAARLAGARLRESPEKKWLRYYGQDGQSARMSYRFALAQPQNYFRDQIVFVGNQPKSSVSDGEPDKYCTPYARWTFEAKGGVEILLTSFLNLVNEDWLRRVSPWKEAAALVLAGTLLGAGLPWLRPMPSIFSVSAAGVAITAAAVLISYFTNYWFPWLVIAGGQMPCALVWALATRKSNQSAEDPVGDRDANARPSAAQDLPDIPGYKLLPCPFGEGAYGKVWLARNAAGQWRAVKVIYLANFRNDAVPYDREFNGIKRYHAISDKHQTMLRVEYVSEKLAGYFYYVMELGDPLEPGWERDPSTYKPRNLASELARAEGRRLQVQQCLFIGIELSDALDFLHQQGLTHRDIKPQNIIFVNGRPKLADLGLIAEIRPPDQPRSLVGTPGYMPPPPELPGTPQADIYALGIVLYVLSSGRTTAFFPEITTTLAESMNSAEFFPLNSIILKACHPDLAHRYASASEVRQSLLEARDAVERAMTRKARQPA